MTLTKKDTDLLQELSKGYTYKKIAEIMHVSPRTIEWRIQRIKQKIGAKNKVEIINYLNAQTSQGSLIEKIFASCKKLIQ